MEGRGYIVNRTGELNSAQYFEICYGELCASARSALRRYPAASIRPTEVVHEVFLRLEGDRSGGDRIRWSDKYHFMKTASRAIRFAIIDTVKREAAAKRRLDFTNRASVSYVEVALFEKLLVLEVWDTLRKNRALIDVATTRFIHGYTIEETAILLGMSYRGVRLATARIRALFCRSHEAPHQ